MNTSSVQIKEPASLPVAGPAEETIRSTTTTTTGSVEDKARIRFWTLLLVPVATAAGWAVHHALAAKEPSVDPLYYSVFLAGAFAISVLAGALQWVWPGLRRWMMQMCPIIAGLFVVLGLWEVITSGLRLLPMPYFPSPAGVLQSMVSDRTLLLVSTWSSLKLLLSGYFIGVAVALVTGICIGWFPLARYWGMPVLKIVGPIPATAWVPLAMVLSPFPGFSAVGLVALAVWFPVTMLTISGVANTRASYLDVARTLGAGQRYLIFRVAIPAAMPSIFIGLFMGLGTSFLTLIVAETVGVKSGLGWYVGWAQGWAEYGKVYGALVIMAVFFSTIMTLLFKIRDRVLVWQKGTIKW
jgi:NitT/TauT family transport system permease protein